METLKTVLGPMLSFLSEKAKPFLKSRKTTMAALTLVIAAIFSLVKALGAMSDDDPSTIANWELVAGEILAAIGLFFSRDADKSSRQTGIE